MISHDLNTQNSPAASTFAAGLVNLRDTVKWMIAASSAVAAVLIAGLQLKDLGTLAGSSSLRLAVAMASAAVALFLVILVIVTAVRVLATPRLSVRDLSDREIKTADTSWQIRLEPLSDKLVQSLLEQRTYLLGQHESIMAFYRDYVAVMGARADVNGGQVAHFRGRDFTPGNTRDDATLAALVWQAQHDAERLEDAAQLILAESRFQQLSGWLPLGGLVFAAAVLAFAWITSTSISAAVVTKPSPVDIYIKDARLAGLPPGCGANELAGVAIAGTFLNPTIVTQTTPSCPSTVIYNGAGVVVVPIADTPSYPPMSR